MASKKTLKSNDFKYLRFAQWLCLSFLALFVGFVFMLMSIHNMNYQQIIVQYPVLTTGFIVCVMNLYIWYETKKMKEDLQQNKHIGYYQVLLCLFCLTQFLLFNYPAAILFTLVLYRNFSWEKKHFPIAALKEDGMFSKLVLNIVVLVLCIVMALWFVASFS